MFDVSWNDLSRETVGQRKSRKEHQQGSLPLASSILTSTSSDASSTKHRPSKLAIFNGSKKDLSRTGLQRSDQVKEGFSVDSCSPVQELRPGTVATHIPFNNLPAAGLHYSTGRDISSSIGDASFSAWAARSDTTESTWTSIADSTVESHLVQPLSPTSFVTQSTQVTVNSRKDIKDTEHRATFVHISSEGPMTMEVQDLDTKRPMTSPTYDFPKPDFHQLEKMSSLTLQNYVIAPPVDHHLIGRGNQSESWKAPEIWDCPSGERAIPKMPPPKSAERPHQRLSGDEQTLPWSQITHLQRSIQRMEAASPKIVLERLTEEWTGVADAAIHRELELEKQLWMLTALQTPNRKKLDRTNISSRKGGLEPDPLSSGVIKILSLHEDHAPASFLSALNPSSEVHHFSTDPLSPTSYPNVHPLSVPGATPKLPYATNIFSSIHAFSLPALLPSSSIPTILKDCHRTLLSSSPTSHGTSKAGSLHLTVLDPSPSPATTGPRLRDWLDKHLILNLERQFRCINPCRLFPIWLADAGLGAEGSTIVRVRFAAATETALISSYNRGGGGAEETREELRHVIGRMLWEEIWGRFVEGKGRWWEEGDVMEECVRMGTTWEYLVIEALKEG